MTGLRIAHPDCLFDPEQYFLDLQSACRRILPTSSSSDVDLSEETTERACYVVVEKILVGDERLRPQWPVHGTTGYDFLNLLNGIFVNMAGGPPFRELYARFMGTVLPLENKKPQIFLCYAREDENQVRNLYQRLSKNDFKPWMDKEDLLGGEQWEDSIEKAIRHSDFCLVCLSTNSTNKRGVIRKEIKIALDICREMLPSDIYMIPLRLENCEVPEDLSHIQWTDYYAQDGWTKLLKALRAGMERRAKPMKPSVQEPVSFESRQTHLDFGDVVYESKKLILNSSLSGLVRRLDRISRQHRWSRDLTFFGFQEALREVMACFPVYRTYVRSAFNVMDDEDLGYILSALEMAKRRNRGMNESILDFLASVLLLQEPEGLSELEQAERRDFVMRFQQLTGPVTAEGLYYTALYRYFPLASLNEIGGNPEKFGLSVEEFHRQNAERLADWPHTLLATSTHDTKWGEDVRARINVLSEIPHEWERAIQRWRSWNCEKKLELDGAEVPDANEEYLLYQTLIGAWPLDPMDEEGLAQFSLRIEQYMEKALKEAKVHTSWINPNEAYEQAVRYFVQSLLDPDPGNQFVADFVEFHAGIADAGIWNSLSQTLLKVASPGVPDFYQGTESWDFSLAEPDNRRPVDFSIRMEWLERVKRQESGKMIPLIRELLRHRKDGRIKLYVTSQALNFRRIHSELFLNGEYFPLMVSGPLRDHAVAFARRNNTMWTLVVVPRLLMKLSSLGEPPIGRSVWKESVLAVPKDAPKHWRNVCTGEDVVSSSTSQQVSILSLSAIFRHFPVALLEGRLEE